MAATSVEEAVVIYIAALLGISPKSVEVERHRLRKKLGLTRSQNLIDFIKAL